MKSVARSTRSWSKGQIVGGAWMAIGHTLCEPTAPYYPTTEHAPLDLLNYGMTGVAEMP
jgi:CO/xanthine dehydrogenase Mo-binding subunit